MATQIILEKASGNYQSMSLPLHVFNDDYSLLTQDAAIAAVNAAEGVLVPATFNGFPNDGNPAIRHLSKSAWQITINYREPNLRNLRPPETGTKRNGFNFQVPRRHISYAPQVGAFYRDGTPEFNTYGMVDLFRDSLGMLQTRGTYIDPPPISFTTEEMIDPATITASWVRTLAAVIQAGAVNSTSMGGGAYAAGELMIGYCNGNQISDEGFRIETGWCWQQNVTGEVRGAVEGFSDGIEVNYDGHDYVWNWTTPGIVVVPMGETTKKVTEEQLSAVFVHRIRPRVDLSGIGLTPP